MKCLDNLGVEEVIFESDSRILINALKNPHLWPMPESFTREITEGKRMFLKPSFKFQGRQSNVCADTIAKKASSMIVVPTLA